MNVGKQKKKWDGTNKKTWISVSDFLAKGRWSQRQPGCCRSGRQGKTVLMGETEIPGGTGSRQARRKTDSALNMNDSRTLRLD